MVDGQFRAHRRLRARQGQQSLVAPAAVAVVEGVVRGEVARQRRAGRVVVVGRIRRPLARVMGEGKIDVQEKRPVRMASDEPDALVASLIGDGGRTLSLIRRFVARQLRAEQRAGHVDADVDVDLVAELMVRVSASFLLTPSDVVDLDDDDQTEAMVRQFLVPMLHPAAPTSARRSRTRRSRG